MEYGFQGAARDSFVIVIIDTHSRSNVINTFRDLTGLMPGSRVG